MSITEHTINDAIADLLGETRKAWRQGNCVTSENTGMLKGSSKRPDILVNEHMVSPVVVETEVFPAVSVETETKNRLGEELRTSGRRILSAIAVRLPDRLRELHGKSLKSALNSAADIEMALFTGTSPTAAQRWPLSGWLAGELIDLSLLVQMASVPPDVIEQAADELVNGVSEAASLLEAIANQHPGSVHKISEELHQEDGEQTRRMAITILANAFVFQESLAGGPGKLLDVLSIEQLRGNSGGVGKSAVLSEWRKILKVNYWPIFDIARRILELIPADGCRSIIERLTITAERLLENRLMRSHDLTGAVFQRLIADRKFLAAYYTTPASATLLIGLAFSADKTPAGTDWGSPKALTSLRVADFACGTGTLVSTAYQRLGQLHELAGGDSEALHAEMMEKVLVGCDVLPAAAHLTASMLSGAHPTIRYNACNIMTIAYGKQPDGGIALGSLDLLDPQKDLAIVEITAKAVGGTGESARDTFSDLPDKSFDLVVMNPPFTRNVGHEGKKVGVPNPMFAAFSSSSEEQKQMSKATDRLTPGTCYHGNAGEASLFLSLADRKLKVGGTLALVMPLSLLSGDAWEGARTLLAENYSDLILVSIAGSADDEMSFSADTGMGECLVIAKKRSGKNRRATFVVLKQRPAFPILGFSAAAQIRRLINSGGIQTLEDGPMGGSQILFGSDVIGEAMNAPLPALGPWNPTRISDLSLAQAAHQLCIQGKIWLPGMTKKGAKIIPTVPLEKIAEFGPYHADINFGGPKGTIRGPFDLQEIGPQATPTYPILWSHQADRERSMCFEADNEGRPKAVKSVADRELVALKIEKIIATASHCHFNQNFRFNSQSTAMQFTSRRTIGGRAWLSIKLATTEQEKTLTVWGNTSLGLLSHWYHSNKQQAGRGNTVPTQLKNLIVLDVTKISEAQLEAATAIFDEFATQDLMPINEINQDKVRQALDAKFGMKVLGLSKEFVGEGGPIQLLRNKLAAESSIRGTKVGAQIQKDKED